MSNSRAANRTMAILIGAAMLCFAAVVPNQKYASFLLGDNAKDLTWGVSLFRLLLAFHGILLIAAAGLYKSEKTNGSSKPQSENKRPENGLLVWCALAFLTASGLALRLVNLNSDLWVDEVFTLIDFVRPSFGEILTSFPNQNQHLLYSVLAHASTNVFGESAWALRLPAVLFGTACIWALFLLCRKLLGTPEALLAATLLTVSYHHIWFSQNARGYTGLLFFTLLATWLWFEALERERWGWWLGYAAAIVGGMCVHMTMAFVVASHGVVYLLFLFSPVMRGERRDLCPERRAGIKPLAAWFLSVTVTLQLYALALPEFLREGLHEESGNSEWTNPLWVLTEIFTNLSIGFAGLAVVVAGAAFVAFGWLSLFKKNSRAAILMVLPPVFAGALMLGLGHNLFPRFFFFAMGFGLIIVVHGAAELPRFLLNAAGVGKMSEKLREQTGFALVLLIAAISLTTVPRNYALPKQNFSGAKRFVENSLTPGDAVVAVSIAGEIYDRYFAVPWINAKTGAQLEDAEKGVGKVWLVYTLAPEIKAFRPELWRAIERDYEVVQIFPGTLQGGEIFVCRKRSNNEEKNETSRNSGNGTGSFVQKQQAQIR